jgi:methionine synthase II (cobalamin-independent)
MTPLRLQMIEDMRSAGLAPGTQCREPSWRENMELRSKKAIEWVLPHFLLRP